LGDFGVDESFNFKDNKTINSFRELLEIKDGRKAQEALTEWASQYSDNELARLWGVKFQRIKNARGYLAIVKDTGGNLTCGNTLNWTEHTINILKRGYLSDIGEEVPKEKPQTSQKKDDIVFLRESGYQINLSGVFKTQELSDRLEGLNTILSSVNDSKFYVEISVKEVGG